jgi:hypothetical protein
MRADRDELRETVMFGCLLSVNRFTPCHDRTFVVPTALSGAAQCPTGAKVRQCRMLHALPTWQQGRKRVPQTPTWEDGVAHLVTDRIVAGLHRAAIVLLVLSGCTIIGAIALTTTPRELIAAVAFGGFSFGVPGLGLLGVAYWLDGQTAALEGHPGDRRAIHRDEAAKHPFRAPLVGYVIAVASTLFAWGLRVVIDPLLPGSVPFVTFFLAIALSGWMGGYGPAVLATALSAVVARYFYMTPFHSFLLLDPSSAFRLGMFVFIGVIVGSLTAALRAALQRVQQLSDRLAAMESERRSAEASK